MANSNRLTFNANVSELGDAEKFIRTLQAWKPAFVVLMNGLNGDTFKRIQATLQAGTARLSIGITRKPTAIYGGCVRRRIMCVCCKA